MIVHEGLIGAWNYTVGPAIIYESRSAIERIQKTGDPFVVVVPDTIPLKDMFAIDIRHIRGFVLARGEKDDMFTAFVISQRRAAVRCVSGILDGLANGDLVAVDGVNGKVYVRPDAKTVAFFEARRVEPAPEIRKEHLPRLALEAMRTAKVPDMGPVPALPPMPAMLSQSKWPSAGGPDVMPKDAPTPSEIKAKVEEGIQVLVTNVELARVTVWKAVAQAKINMFMERELTPDEVDLINETVVEEYTRLEKERTPATLPAPRVEEPEGPERRGRNRLTTSVTTEVSTEAVSAPEVSLPRAAEAPEVAEVAEVTEVAEVAEVAEVTEVEKADEKDGTGAPRTSAGSRRAQREAEIAAARAARSGTAPEPAKEAPTPEPELATATPMPEPEPATAPTLEPEAATAAPAPEPEPATAPTLEPEAATAAPAPEPEPATAAPAPEPEPATAAPAPEPEPAKESAGAPEGAETVEPAASDESAGAEEGAAIEDAASPDATSRPGRRPSRRRATRPPPPPPPKE